MVDRENQNNPFQIIKPVYSSQSAISSYQECPRRYLFNYRYYGTGITRNYTSIPLATGSCIHAGVESIARQHIGSGGKMVDVDIAVSAAQDEYRGIVNKFPFAKVNDTQQENVFQEQLALIEALIRLWYLAEYPKITKFYEILACEQEIIVPMEAVLFQVRPDLILRDTKNGDIINYSLKTTKSYDDRTAQALTSQLQVSTEPFGTNEWLRQIKAAAVDALQALDVLPESPVNEKIKERLKRWLELPDRSSATRFCYLIKGAWKEENKGQGDWYTDSSLIYGWRKFTPQGIEYAPSFWTNNPENKSGFGRLGKGWEKFKVWENNDIREDVHLNGVKGWIDYLATNHLDTLMKYIHSEPEVYVNPQLMESRVRQVQTLENLAISGLEAMTHSANSHYPMLDAMFPMNTNSCFFPSQCDYLTICPNGNRYYKAHVAADPLNPEFGEYRRRESHHKPEQQTFAAYQAQIESESMDEQIKEREENEGTGTIELTEG